MGSHWVVGCILVWSRHWRRVGCGREAFWNVQILECGAAGLGMQEQCRRDGLDVLYPINASSHLPLTEHRRLPSLRLRCNFSAPVMESRLGPCYGVRRGS